MRADRPADWTTVRSGFREAEISDNHLTGNNSCKVTDNATGELNATGNVEC